MLPTHVRKVFQKIEVNRVFGVQQNRLYSDKEEKADGVKNKGVFDNRSKSFQEVWIRRENARQLKKLKKQLEELEKKRNMKKGKSSADENSGSE